MNTLRDSDYVLSCGTETVPQFKRIKHPMCGIAGLIDKKGTISNIVEKIDDMTHLIQHRGPDGSGVFCYQNVGFGHRRLAILDLSPDGKQPMYYADDQLVITYNGEIYNYIEIRQELESMGYLFRSRTDTEVILASYAAWGQDCVKRFNGMWAFAILDKLKHLIFFSRDRYGVKPFYYTNSSQLFAFGSEIKQLLPFLHTVSANQDEIKNFILTSVSDHDNTTFFNDILKLPASHNLIYSLEKNTFTVQPYYQITFNPEFATLSAEDAVESYIHLLEDAVRLRLRSDVLVGTCLSGGLDSSSVASIAAPLYHSSSSMPFNAITAISEQESNNEARYAKQVVDAHHLNWLQVRPDYSDFVALLPKIVLAQEEPFGSTSLVMQYVVMKTARSHGISVLLDGQGGDETLLGYEKYYGSYLLTLFRNQGVLAGIKAFQSARMNNAKLSLSNAMKYVLGGSMGFLRHLFYCHRHNYLRKPLPYVAHLAAYSRSSRDVFQLQRLEIERTNLPVLLRYEDKNSMAHSIETRLPFLDYRVVEAALSLPGQYKIKEGWSKWLLRKGMENRMPADIVWRKNKFGFEAPESQWLQKHFHEMHTVIQRSPLLNAISNPEQLKKNYSCLDLRSQWRLYSIALWEKAFGISL